MQTAAKKMATPLHQLTATQIVDAIVSGKTTCETVARACLDRIAAREAQVQAWQCIDPDYVIARAGALDKSGQRGPLIGVPFGVKDIIDTCDMPTEYGSAIYQGHQPKSDAACVALSRKAGGVLMGKTVTTEFASSHPGKTRNPLDLERTPGGTSSGSGAAVGDYMVPIALGTQTTGSTTRPASYCGVFGYRPTWGDLRSTGVMESSGTLDTLGVFARSIEDLALYRDVLLGITPEPIAQNVPVPRIGFCRTHVWPKLEATTQKLMEDAAGQLARAGARVVEVTLPKEFEGLEAAHRWISCFEFARNRTWDIEHHWEEINETLRNGKLEDGLSCSYERYVSMHELVERCRQLLTPIFNDCDVLLAAAAAGEAPVGWNPTFDPWVHVIWTTMHVPSVTLPVFKGPHGLPVGAQLIGRRHGDRELFAAARWVYRQLIQLP